MPVDDSRTYITERVEAMLEDLADRYRIEIKDVQEYRGSKFSQVIVFEHIDGSFKLIDWEDRDRPEKMKYRNLIDHEQCHFVLKCQYNPVWRIPKVRPFFYFEKTKPKQFSDSLARLRQVPKKGTSLHWRGNVHQNRNQIIHDLEDLLNKDHAERLDLANFYEDLASHKIALSLPGLGNSCHREFECFGIGTVVISPKFENIYHMPLIPDVHYLAVGCGSAKEIRKRLERTTEEEIQFIRGEAMKYYDTFIRFESSVKLLPHILEL